MGEQPMKLTGTCTLAIAGHAERALIEFDISAQTIAVWRMSSGDLTDLDFFAEPKGISSKPISVKDIEVFSPTAALSCKRLPPLFLSSSGSSGFSIDDGETSKIMAIGEGRIHAKRLDLTLRRSKLTFAVKPFSDRMQLSHESIFTNHGKHWNECFSVAIGKRSLKVRYSPRHIFVSGKLRNTDVEMLRHACSLIALGPEQLIAQLKPPRITLNYAWEKLKAYGETVVPTEDLPPSFQHIMNHLVDCDEETRRKRFYEMTHLVEGFRQGIFVEYRLTNLLKALESFDRSRTLSPNGLEKLFGMQKGDARFFCGIRNYLVHQGVSLAEAAKRTHADLTSRNVKMDRFALLPQTRRLPWRLYVTFSRLIVSAYFRQIGVRRTNRLFSKFKGF